MFAYDFGKRKEPCGDCWDGHCTMNCGPAACHQRCKVTVMGRHGPKTQKERMMSIIDQAKTELAAVNFGEDDSRVMIEILEKFFDQWDSGGAVHAVAPVLQRLIAGKPITPLTGADAEWCEVNDECFQNRRCSTVFKEKDSKGAWIVYDIDRANPSVPPSPKTKARHRWAHCEITLPYWPDRAEVSSPVVEIG